MFGSVPEDIVGVIGGDWLHHVRTRIAAGLAQKTTRILEERGILEQTVPVSPSVALPMLEAAQDEAREELQEIWARLLANAMDPQRCALVRRPVIGVVRQLEPEDAVALELISFKEVNRPEICSAKTGQGDSSAMNNFKLIASFVKCGDFPNSRGWDLPELKKSFEPMASLVAKLTENDLLAAFDHLKTLDCVTGANPAIYEHVQLTPLARQVIEACKP